MPPMPVQQGRAGPGMTTFQKWKMGAMMGGTVGLVMGFIYGGLVVMRGQSGPNGPLRTLGQYMGMSAATFGFFMSIGAVVRSEGLYPDGEERYAMAYRRPIIRELHKASIRN